MAQHHKSTSTELSRSRNSPRSGKQFQKKSSSSGRKPSKKDRTRNHTIKQPLSQATTNGSTKKTSRSSFHHSSSSTTTTEYALIPVEGTKGKMGRPATVYYCETTYDVAPSNSSGGKRRTGNGGDVVQTKTSKFSYLMSNEEVYSGIVRTSSRTSRNGRKPSRRLDMAIDDGYDDDYDCSPSIWAY